MDDEVSRALDSIEGKHHNVNWFPKELKIIRAALAKVGPQYCTGDDMEKHVLREEIQRLNKCLDFEQHWKSRLGTHGPGCWAWGPNHYECAVKEIKGER